MRTITFAFGIVILLSACQKEPNFVDPNGTSGGSGGTGTTAGTRLVRVGTRTGSDSITTTFVYNSANALTRIAYAGTIGAQATDAQIRVVRNAANVITSSVATSNIYVAIGLDSVITKYTYDAGLGRYKYGLAKYVYLGVAMADSAVFVYDASGKLVSGITYADDGSGGGYVLDSKTEYTYTGSNIATEKSYSYNGSSYDLDQSTTYDSYDAKINPLLFPKDAPVLGMTTYYSANNPTKKTVFDNSGLSPVTSAASFTYSYNASNLPTKVTSTDGTATSTSSYYYQ